MLGPREAIALFVVLFAGLVAGRVIARRLAGQLTPPERCLFIGPTDEALRFREKIETTHATNAKLVAQIDLAQRIPVGGAGRRRPRRSPTRASSLADSRSSG